MIPGGLNGNKSWSGFQLVGDHDRSRGALTRTRGRGDWGTWHLGGTHGVVHIAGLGHVRGGWDRDTAGGLDTSCATCEGLQLKTARVLEAVVIGQVGLGSCNSVHRGRARWDRQHTSSCLLRGGAQLEGLGYLCPELVRRKEEAGRGHHGGGLLGCGRRWGSRLTKLTPSCSGWELLLL